MRVRKLDENGDLVTSGGTWAYDAYAVAQTVKTRLALFIGEYFRDITDGMPWFEKLDGTPGILSKGYSRDIVDSLIRSRISETEGVTQILKFSSSFNVQERTYSVAATILTEYGEVSVSYGDA